MRRFMGILLVIGLAALISGCIESKQVYTLNPDGSGKVTVTSIWQTMESMGLEVEGSAKVAKNNLKTAVRNTLEKSEGVDAWKDVSYKMTDDGRMYFQGTAYFKDMSKLQFVFGDDELKVGNIALKKDADGNMIFELESAAKKEKKPAKKLSEEEIAKEMKTAKAAWTASKPILTALLSTMKLDYMFYLPGTVVESSNFKRDEKGGLGLTIEGAKVIKAMEDLYADDALLREEILAGSDPSQDFSEKGSLRINKVMFGQAAPVRATITEVKPQFNYAAEVALAKKKYPKLLKKLGIKPKAPPLAPAKGGKFRNLVVKGVKMEDDEYSLTLVGELPGTVTKVKSGMATKAIANNGENLLPEREWDRKIHFPRLKDDKSTVEFRVDLLAPSKKVKGIKEVAGTLQYVVGIKPKKVNIGITEFKADAAGKEYDAVVVSVKESTWQEGAENMQLALGFSPEQLLTATFYDQAGNVLDVSKRGYSSSGGRSVLTFSCDEGFPDKGKIVLEVYEEMKVFDIPFKITNINLMGRPLK